MQVQDHQHKYIFLTFLTNKFNIIYHCVISKCFDTSFESIIHNLSFMTNVLRFHEFLEIRMGSKNSLSSSVQSKHSSSTSPQLYRSPTLNFASIDYFTRSCQRSSDPPLRSMQAHKISQGNTQRRRNAIQRANPSRKPEPSSWSRSR